jgi:hypothetical protein
MKWPTGNIVLIGSLRNSLILDILSQGKTPFQTMDNYLTLNGHTIRTDSNTGNVLHLCLFVRLTLIEISKA